MQTNPLLVVNVTSIDKFYGSSNDELTTCDSEHSFPCLCSGDGQDPPNCTPQLCVSNQQTYPCICTGSHQPAGCTCPTVPAELVGIPINMCDCLPSGDKRQECIPVACESETIPTQGCNCSTQFHPNNCICPKTADELVGIPDDICQCLKVGDLRGPCNDCSSTFQTEGCICPKTADELVGIPDDICQCLKVGDLRGPCNDCSSTFQTEGCICPKTADELVGIPKDMCDCLPTGDLRVECVPIECKSVDTIPTEGCICTSAFHPDRCFCPINPEDLEGISSIQCRCLQSDDERKECQPPEIGEDPSIDFGEIKPAEQIEIEEIKEESRNDENSVENIISETIDGKNSVDVTLPQNEVYEEENTIKVLQNQKLVLEANIDPEDQQIPVIRPSEEFTEYSNPLISVSNNGDMEIRSFIIEHFTQETQSPLLKTENDGVLRL
ncbi:MAG: hypothetical protein EZS28_043856, partial [Streblomastix strix]